MNNRISTASINKINLITIILLFIISAGINYAQNITVSGKVTSSRFPVQNALITIIDEGDTNKQYTALTDSRGNYEIGTITSINGNTVETPVKFKLGQSYPNPFSSSASIPYGLKEESKVRVTIYDILGRVVRKFSAGYQSVGSHSILWDGRNNSGQLVSNGVYFYRLNADGESQVKKMIFNQTGNGSFALPGSYSLIENNSLAKTGLANKVESTSFTVRVENSDNTNPMIVPQSLNNVVIQNDTTISFDVTSLSLATVNSDSLHQVIRGFGGSNILMWRPDMTESEVERAFGTGENQLGFTIMRLMVEPDSNRWSVSVPSAKLAYELGATIIAAPWHAPSELSENVVNENNENINRVRYDKYAEYAEHLNSFVRYMNDNGVPIYGVSVQNEPDIEENWTSWTSDEIFTFMRDYAHSIEGTNVMAPESFHFSRNYSDPILNDAVAAANTDIVCGHIYGSGLSEYPLAAEKGKEVWMTEHLSGEDSTPDDWYWALSAGKEINDVMQVGMSAYVWWYIVRYYGPLSDGSYLRKGEITKKGYVMSQFSRFIRPGYYRVKCDVSPRAGNVEVTAYVDPATSKIVIVAVNSGTSEVDHMFSINEGTPITRFISYTTSETKDCEMGEEINVVNEEFNFVLDPQSITTFISN